MESTGEIDSTGPAPSAGNRPTDMSPSETKNRKHPHFDDRGTLDWHTSIETALATAKQSGKHLFIEIGREL